MHFLKDDSQWTAQCLEYDIAAQGSTIQDAVFEFQRTFVAELSVCASNGQSLEEIDAAPNYYWKLFERAGAPLRDDPTPPFRFPDALPPRLIPPTYRQLRVAECRQLMNLSVVVIFEVISSQQSAIIRYYISVRRVFKKI